jgi:hypothetical protein
MVNRWCLPIWSAKLVSGLLYAKSITSIRFEGGREAIWHVLASASGSGSVTQATWLITAEGMVWTLFISFIPEYMQA